MAETTILARQRPRRGSAAVWTGTNPILKLAEIGIEIPGGKFKTGDGVTAWVDLPYTVGADGTAATITIGTVASLPSGSTPVITNSGTSLNAVFDFELPVGDPGITIPDPAGLTTETDILDTDKFLFPQGSSLLNVLWSTVKSKLVTYFNTLYGALANTPTSDQKAALAGAYGTPSASNPYAMKDGMVTAFSDYPAASYTFPSSGTPVAFSAGKLPIGAVTTNPTKGTTSEDKAQWAKRFDEISIKANYKQTGAGSAGSGIYLFPVPSPYTIDLTKNPIGSVVGIIHISQVAIPEVSVGAQGYVYVYSSTLLRLAYPQSGTSGDVYFEVSSTAYSIANSGQTYRFNATVSCAQFTPWGYV